MVMLQIKAESFTGALSELIPLFFEHEKEVVVFSPKQMPLAPNWQLYVMKERTNELLTIIARDMGKIVGYYMAFVSPCPHYSTTLRATQDNIRVIPAYRAKGVATLMLIQAEDELRRRGAQIWHNGSRVGSDTHEGMCKLLNKIGAVPIDLYYAKWIG